MKKIVSAVAAALAFAALSFAPMTYAADPAPAAGASSDGGSDNGSGSFVYVTEEIPGAGCSQVRGGTDQTKRIFKCPIGKGFSSVTGVLGSLIKYATYLTGLIGVLMIVLSGIQYSLSGGGEDAKKAKGRIMQLVSGLVLLFLTGLILNTVAPWVYK